MFPGGFSSTSLIKTSPRLTPERAIKAATKAENKIEEDIELIFKDLFQRLKDINPNSPTS
jgi:hypothetical protein